MAAHASTRTTQLYDRREDRVTLDDLGSDSTSFSSMASLAALVPATSRHDVEVLT